MPVNLCDAKFGYQWEDPVFEEKCLEAFDDFPCQDILLIGSGGEMLFHLLYKFGDKLRHITCLDFNQCQIDLIKNKYENIKNGKLNIYYGSVFEELFYKSMANNEWDNYFSKDNLTAIFTDNAVKYTNESFSNHFKTRCSNLPENSSYYSLLKYKKYNVLPDFYTGFDIVIRNWHKVSFVQNNILSYLASNTYKYDFMSLSNITDWINETQCELFYKLIADHLNDCGKVVLRRLLSDNIISETNDLTNINVNYKDMTNFYSQVVCLMKKPTIVKSIAHNITCNNHYNNH